ncbi:MAG: NAD(P)/FAD-dependent oxidoreductase [Rubritalea sp.]|jgi:predicted Rossmann fold flavoprotein
MNYDLIVIGGGAAGFFGAITCAENSNNKAKVLILEKSSQLLQKVKISGGGRCNVTHDCMDPRSLSKSYPRGERSLIGPFNRFQASDTVEWFTSRGVELKTEEDGRMFPTTNNSMTIIDTLMDAAENAGVEIRTSEGVAAILKEDDNRYLITTDDGNTLTASNILIATGGTRLAAGAKLAGSLGHSLTPPVPSLFTFKIKDSRLNHLSGLSVEHTTVHIPGTKLTSQGPLLITHWGMSGPGILKISAWGARQLSDMGYKFQISINWVPNEDPQQIINKQRTEGGKRQVGTYSPFSDVPKRLWLSFLKAANIGDTTLWSQLTKPLTEKLIYQLTESKFHVDGKSLNKDEFVTCGGVQLKEINLKTMESKLNKGIYFAGEVMDIDGITGGFNFQSAWTTGYHAGISVGTDLEK